MLPEAAEQPKFLARLWAMSERRLQLLVLAAALGVVFAVAAIWVARADFSDLEYWKGLGYPGVFFLTMLASASVVIPVPGILAVCGAGGIQLNLFAVAALSGVGEAIGELSGYGVGYGGRGVVEKRKFYERSKRWMERRGTLALFVVSVIPNPFFDVEGIAAGATRFPLTKFLLTVGIGKAIKALVVAYTCWWGWHLLPWVTG